MPQEETEATAGLGPARRLWDDLLASLPECDIHEWKSYSSKAAASLRLKHGKRVIVYLLPGHGAFQASFALSDRAVQAARSAGLPGLEGAKKYAEGTAVRIQVKTAEEVALVRKFAAIKMAN